MALTQCVDCHEPMRDELSICPHCGRPGLFPNVNVAVRPEETNALNDRYLAAQNSIATRGVTSEAAEFENAAGLSQAVICKYFGEAYGMSFSDDIIYATFYQKTHSGMRIPGGDKWDLLRAMADTALFNDVNKVHVRFAALAIDGIGVEHYGECSLLLKEDMIAHRASVFDQNSVIFMRTHKVSAENDYKIPEGFRADWKTRGRLALAKLADSLNKGTGLAEFTGLLLKPGIDNEKDEFVEVHIWGPMTIRSIKEVTVRYWAAEPSAAEVKVFVEKLRSFGITLTLPPV
jgi:hypothetical protein